jgi:CelD/BcsL family acetyltransferase involved in cellulose biosynthesis
MNIFTLDPRFDSRWARFISRHPRASVFHTPGWLEALRHTYGYEPVVYTTSPPGQDLTDGVAFCHVNSRLTGRRLVSLPFSDHCEPLVDDPQKLAFLLSNLQADQRAKNWKYLEVRPLSGIFRNALTDDSFNPCRCYYLHTINLRTDLNEIFQRLHKDSIQRRIRKAERQGLRYECGRCESILERYYRLALLTRQRQGVPPHPLEWYQNLRDCMGDAMEIHMASQGDLPVASIITLRFRDSVYYKYGSSDPAYKSLGATPFLLWRAIEAAKATGAQELDLGRSDFDNEGLIAFKDKWASARASLIYWRSPFPEGKSLYNSRTVNIARRVFVLMPKPLLTITGKLLYRHFG